MPLGLSIPSPAGRGSPASDDSSQIQTPVTPSFAENSHAPSGSDVKSTKRKASRRHSNSAEKRANHNAVERARRETLNGRFLDLAALLPNLSQIRRPSKSAIVNSSISHIHASRRHRQLASRELRLLKLEADALRRELNEWRDRANIPRVQEPVRGDAFSMVLSGEIEVLPIPTIEEEEGEYGYGDEDVVVTGNSNPYPSETPISEPESMEISHQQNLPHRPPSNGYDMSLEQQQQMMRRGAGPMVASSNAMAVENPAMGMVYNNIPYPSPYMPEMEQGNKWAPGPRADPEVMASISRRGSVPITSDIRQNRNRSMSASSSGSGSPSHMAYYDPGWNAQMGGMAPPPMSGPNMGMMGGGGSVGNSGAVFAMM